MEVFLLGGSTYRYARRRMKSSTKADSSSRSWSSEPKSEKPGMLLAHFLITSTEAVSKS